MKIHLIKEKTIRQFVSGNSAGRASFIDWLSKVKMADWNTPEDVKNTFPSADFLGNNTQRVID